MASVFSRIRAGLAKTAQQIRERLGSGIEEAGTPAAMSGPPVAGRALSVDTLEALEDALLTADVGLHATERILEAVRSDREGTLRERVGRVMTRILSDVHRPPAITERPHVVLVVGVNGTGKTTTVGKLASLYRAEGHDVMVCAADTFRAAAVEQLAVWTERAGVDLIRAQAGADPAAVTFDAVSAAKARGRDMVIVDTAGRLHTRANLMAELDKIRRVVGREVPGAPHEVLLVLDATVGQNGLVQAREFMAASGANGVVLTKLDGTAKGGVAVAIADDSQAAHPVHRRWRGARRSRALRRTRVRGRPVHREVVGRPDDQAFMARALFWAERGRGRTSPNPNVGAVVVSPDGVVVGQGAHMLAGGPHAEVVALEAAAGRARGATLYCTLEPCAHTGRTGPCVERIVAAGVHRVVAAVEDPNPLVAGQGLAFLRRHAVEVVVGVGEAEARRQLAPFLTWMTARRPFVILKAATSADGFVGGRDGPVRLTGPAADRFFHRQRAEIDALAVGATTVLVDDPLLTARGAYRVRPLTRVLFDWRARIPASAHVFSTVSAGPVIMVVSERALVDAPAHFTELHRLGVSIEAFEARDLPVGTRTAGGARDPLAAGRRGADAAGGVRRRRTGRPGAVGRHASAARLGRPGHHRGRAGPGGGRAAAHPSARRRPAHRIRCSQD